MRIERALEAASEKKMHERTVYTTFPEIFNPTASAAQYVHGIEYLLDSAVYLNILRKNFILMDLGCGRGDLVHSLALRYPQARFFGVDYFYQFDNIGALDNCTYHEADQMDVLEENAFVDVILISNNFQSPESYHSVDVDLYMAQFERLILYKSKLFISNFNKEQLIRYSNGVAAYNDNISTIVVDTCGLSNLSLTHDIKSLPRKFISIAMTEPPKGSQ